MSLVDDDLETVKSGPAFEQGSGIAAPADQEPATGCRNGRNSERNGLLATFLTTLAIFAIFMIQGILLARMLGPTGRGEFGPRESQ